MIEKFKSNAEAIATADKYLYGKHARMPIVMDRGEGCWAWATTIPPSWRRWTAPRT